MSDGTKISWTNATWNPITGCSVKSPGCTNCYAMGLAGTRLKHHPSRQGLTSEVNGKHVWNGEVRLNENWLEQPLKWTKPRMIFVCAHGDLFHENVPDEWIDQVFAVMALSPKHTFQVLTKRSGRMQKYIAELEERRAMLDCHSGLDNCPWPLPNVWLGVSAEDQKRADERIPDLLDTLAVTRFVSVEPQLENIHLGYIGWPNGQTVARNGVNALLGMDYRNNRNGAALPKLDWVICGAESGLNKRTFNEDWAISLRDQCQASGTAFFYKQKIGDDGKKVELPFLNGRQWAEFPQIATT